MAGELVSFGVQKLWDLLSQEYDQFKGVDDQVAELKSDLNLLNSFLKDADAKKHTSAMVRNCMEEIKGVICDAEDIIETFILKEKFGKTSGIKKRIKRLACVIPDRREIALDIGGISKRISKLISVLQSFGIQQILADGGYMQSLQDRQREMRQEFARDNENIFVGLEENVKKLVGYLVEEDSTSQVVSITGMGGLGKTTLSRQASNHDKVIKKFDRVVWVSVSQVCDRMNVWQAILPTLRPKEGKEKISEMTETTLHGKLFELLGISKSLVVFDDIWKEEDWDLIKRIFEGERLPDSIGKLIHLRYLNLQNATLFILLASNSSLQNLKLLIYLNLDINYDYLLQLELKLPIVLMGMTELRYLALPRRVHKKTTLELSHLVNLETLINFSVENSNLEDLGGMSRLRTLGIIITGETTLESLSASIGGLRHLEDLRVHCKGATRMKEWRTLLELINLKQLKLEITASLSSDELQFPSCLTTLYLRECRLEEDPMPILEKLLHLKELTFDYKSFSGRRMVCSRGGFPQLHKLLFDGLREWEEWIVEEGSMPLLHTLEIDGCRKLKEVPDGLRFITSLKDLKCYNMGEEWKKRLSEGGEDYYKVQHIPSVRF